MPDGLRFGLFVNGNMKMKDFETPLNTILCIFFLYILIANYMLPIYLIYFYAFDKSQTLSTNDFITSCGKLTSYLAF